MDVRSLPNEATNVGRSVRDGFVSGQRRPARCLTVLGRRSPPVARTDQSACHRLSVASLAAKRWASCGESRACVSFRVWRGSSAPAAGFDMK